VLALGARLIGIEAAKDCVQIFLNTAFAGGRHERRLAKLA
jgi:ribose 5-phosphate isomerase B